MQIKLHEEKNYDKLTCMNWEKRYDTFAVLMSIFLKTASVHIIVSLPFGEVVENVYLFLVLLCYMMMQWKFYQVIVLSGG
jgi:hypothetical protein